MTPNAHILQQNSDTIKEATEYLKKNKSEFTVDTSQKKIKSTNRTKMRGDNSARQLNETGGQLLSSYNYRGRNSQLPNLRLNT